MEPVSKPRAEWDWNLAESLYMSGMNPSDIVRQTGVSAGALRQRRRRHKWPAKRTAVNSHLSAVNGTPQPAKAETTCARDDAEVLRRDVLRDARELRRKAKDAPLLEQAKLLEGVARILKAVTAPDRTSVKVQSNGPTDMSRKQGEPD